MRRTIISTALFSSMLFTAAAYASPPPGQTSAPTFPVSTGITPPEVLNTLNIKFPDQNTRPVPAGTQISLSYVVDENGQPRNIQVVHGYDLVWNARAAEAVSKLRYRPASLDNQPIPMGMNLIITLAR